MIASINPFNGETIRIYEEHSPPETQRRLGLSWNVFHQYRRTPFEERAAKLLRAAEILESEKRRFAEFMTGEMGKTISSAEAEVSKSALGCRYYANEGEKALADVRIETGASRSYVRFQPLGPVLAIMPWNFPFWQVFRFAAPALMAGNTCLLKHASNVPGCALAIEEILLRAGFPEGVFQTLLLEVDKVEALIRDHRIAAVTLTGSEASGRAVASQAGSEIKKTVLELGGSDPFIVMPSADLPEAIRTAVLARVVNYGQSCIAAKRFIIADSIYETFERDFIAGMQALKIGDPMDRSTGIGPLANERIAAALEKQVNRAAAAGAKILTGGSRVAGRRCTFQPTVLTGVPRDSEIFREEIFGPVAMLFRARDAAEAIELANDSPFGLGASVWTRDEMEQAQFIDEIETGQVFVNAMVASDPRLPFGGVKRSGYGRD
ncbi:MAG: NAD-dependent succinate-semialdehyde dehydrogenase [Bryobacteraceae bacterium]